MQKTSTETSKDVQVFFPGAEQSSPKDWLLFETCQRRVYICISSINPADNISPTNPVSIGSIHCGQEAYAKLLAILCGLESKILAETEVFGQFKIFAAALGSNNRFKRVAQDLILDVRQLRKSCLTGVGLRSYGSLSAHYVAKLPSIAMIGGGQLAQKILPYLIESGHQVSMHLRQPAKAVLMPQRMTKNINICSLTEPDKFLPPHGLIIAAPVSSADIACWLKTTGSKPETIIDLRDQTGDIRLDVAARLITLDDLFEQMEKTSSELLRKVENARKEVAVLSNKRFSSRHFRPFGWEDICA